MACYADGLESRHKHHRVTSHRNLPPLCQTGLLSSSWLSFGPLVAATGGAYPRPAAAGLGKEGECFAAPYRRHREHGTEF